MERPLAETARHFFVKASRECPASITAQAAKIALYCQEAKLSPIRLHQELLNDPQSIPFLKSVAERAHQAYDKGPNVLTEELLRGILETDFKRADEYMVLEEDELREIYEGIYFASSDHSSESEKRIREEAKQILDRRLVLVTPD